MESRDIEIAHVALDEPNRAEILLRRLSLRARVDGSDDITIVASELGKDTGACAQIYNATAFLCRAG